MTGAGHGAPGATRGSGAPGPTRLVGHLGLWAIASCLFATTLADNVAIAVEVPTELSKLTRSLAESRTETNYRALERYIGAVSGVDKDLAHFATGLARHNAKQYSAAEKSFAQVGDGIGWLDEYAVYYRARCIVLAEEFDRALDPLERFGKQFPGSRFAPAAERLRVESLMRLGRLDQARSIVASESGSLEEPVRLYLAGRIEHIDGRYRQAVSLYREAYYHYPFSDQADAAETHLNRLRASMGKAYPTAPAKWRLTRAEALYEGREYTRASAEFTRALGAGLSGGDRDRAVVHRGAADYQRGSNSAAYSALARARPNEPELDAERLYLLCALERRQRLVQPMLSSLSKLAGRHPKSPWYQEALLAVGNFYYLRDDRREYPRIFRRLVQAFPTGRHAPYAHWKVCWRAWLDGSADRRTLLTEHARRYPGASTAPGALYWLGRLDEREGGPAAARSRYGAIARAFPHYYYASLGRDRLGQLGEGPSSEEITRTLEAAIPSPRKLSAEPTASTRALLEMGTTLHLIGADREARQEFARVDYRQPDSHFAGLALGRLHSRLDQHHLGLRAMKRYAFGYLRFPLESLDMEYWRYLFPLGWERNLRSRSERHRLDPYLVAALIRQESEYHPGARSRAGALGLMQIMPYTGRQLFQRLGIPGFSNRKLTIPDVSLRLGTFHLKESLAKFDGVVEKALAGYNAGDSRVPKWMELGPFDEVAEFVETIPFSETRGYVQSVLRNRAMYALLYGE